MTFAVFDEQNQAWAGDGGRLSVLTCSDYVYHLAGLSEGGGSQNFYTF